MIPAPQTPSSLIWFKSSYSGAGTTECVEAARLPQATAVRDSKRPAGISAGATIPPAAPPAPCLSSGAIAISTCFELVIPSEKTR